MVAVQAVDTKTWKELAQQLRVDSIRCTTEAGSGHPTSAMSAADLMSVLMSKYLHYDFAQPQNPNNDRLIFSKGHACPLLYSMYKAAGVITEQEFMTLRKDGSRLEGHPVPEVLPWVDVATGSLGQGLPIAVGMALSAKYLDKLPFKVYVLLGDSEMAEGSVWEAFEHAHYYKLDNIIAILDMNRLGQRGQTAVGWDSKTYAARAQAFGWLTIEVDGHNLEQIDQAYSEALKSAGKPILIIAKTEKGHGVAAIANKDGWHGKALKKDEAEKAIAELGGQTNMTIAVAKPGPFNLPDTKKKGNYSVPKYEGLVATREAYGDALKLLGEVYPDLVVVDAEVSNSTFADKFAHAVPERFFEMFIAEQQMVGAAVGLANRGKKVFASTFAAFLTRAYDFIRMAAVSRSHIKLCGSHAGVSIGEDGPSQMALEDLAMMRAILSSTVLYPSDATCAASLTEAMLHAPGISYMRTTREKTAILYGEKEEFHIGGSKTLKESKEDKVAIVAAGITLHEALKAYDSLAKDGIKVRIIDCYSVKPIDADTLAKAAQETGHIMVVEDHCAEGGLGDAVLEGLASKGAICKVTKLAVRKMPGSAKPAQLLAEAGIDADAIVKAVKGK